MTALKFNPLEGSRLFVEYTADECRVERPEGTWRYNPWTGNRRTEADIASDPQGLLIVPPGQPLKAFDHGLLPDSMVSGPLDSITGGQKDPADTITATLSERGKRYGKFTDHAKISQDLEDVMRACPKWAALAPDQKEALKMIVHKIARILNGDPGYDDSWVDIAGYSKLVADRLQGVER